MRSAPAGNWSLDCPCRGWIRHFMPAMRSLIALIARRAIGVSANRRKFAAVGLGIAPARGEYVLRIEGSATVRRFSLEPSRGTRVPVMRRRAPRNADVIFIVSCRVGYVVKVLTD